MYPKMFRLIHVAITIGDRGGTVVNLLAPELFFLILAHTVYKM